LGLDLDLMPGRDRGLFEGFGGHISVGDAGGA
jgi:hypothetical protein